MERTARSAAATELLERIVKIEGKIESNNALIEEKLRDNNETIHKIEQAIFGNGKPGLLSDFRLLADSVSKHHKEADERIKREEEERHRHKLDWQWIITTIVAVAAVVAALIR